MRVLFAGTPAVAIPSLQALHTSSHEVIGVLTRPPAPVGRKRVLTPSPVHSAAELLGLPVITAAPDSPEVLQTLEQVDCVAVVAYGALIREPALSAPIHGWVNLHFSLLPQWRGAAPVQYAVMAGQEETGISVFQIELGLDTGPVYTQIPFPIGSGETAGDLLERLSLAGAPALVEVLTSISEGTARAVPQTAEASHAPTLRSGDARIDWNHPAEVVAARIRGLTPAPGAWTTSSDSRFKVGPVQLTGGACLPPGEVTVRDGAVLVGTSTTPVALDRLAPPGKPWMAATDWARGLRAGGLTFEGTK